MVEQATFLSVEFEFENMVMSMLIINPVHKGAMIWKTRGIPNIFRILIVFRTNNSLHPDHTKWHISLPLCPPHRCTRLGFCQTLLGTWGPLLWRPPDEGPLCPGEVQVGRGTPLLGSTSPIPEFRHFSWVNPGNFTSLGCVIRSSACFVVNAAKISGVFTWTCEMPRCLDSKSPCRWMAS